MEKVGFFIVGKPEQEYLEDLIFEKMRDVLTNEEIKNIAFFENEESHDILYTFLNEEKNLYLFNLFEEYKVLIHYSDITEEVLLQNNINKNLFEGEFKILFERFLKNNLKVDFILDKISKLGVKSLTDIDYKVLKS
ncbi:MAG: hypothetical protein RLZ10_238 [Bacteroidota bacterium]|jgi:hypothetical protein